MSDENAEILAKGFTYSNSPPTSTEGQQEDIWEELRNTCATCGQMRDEHITVGGKTISLADQHEFKPDYEEKDVDGLTPQEYDDWLKSVGL